MKNWLLALLLLGGCTSISQPVPVLVNGQPTGQMYQPPPTCATVPVIDFILETLGRGAVSTAPACQR